MLLLTFFKFLTSFLQLNKIKELQKRMQVPEMLQNVAKYPSYDMQGMH